MDNEQFQRFAKIDATTLLVNALTDFGRKLDRIVSLLELQTLQQQSPSPSIADLMSMGTIRVHDGTAPEIKRPQSDLTNASLVQPKESNIMRDSSGEPEIIRFPLPMAHGTIVYKRINNGQWGFNLSVIGSDGLPHKYERVEGISNVES